MTITDIENPADTPAHIDDMPTPWQERRVGQFRISAMMMEQDYEAMRAVLAELVVLRCERMAYEEEFHYQAVGTPFERLAEGAYAPWYEAEISRDGETGELSVRWRREGSASS